MIGSFVSAETILLVVGLILGYIILNLRSRAWRKELNEDEDRIKKLQIEYEKEVNISDDSPFEEVKDILKTTIRPLLEIENEISKINSELEEISIVKKYSSANYYGNLSVSIEELREIDDLLRNNEDKIYIRKNEEEFSEIFENFKNFENLINIIVPLYHS